MIADYLKHYPQFAVLGKYKSTSPAKEILQSEITVDVIFLDIQMPNETGIEFLKNNDIKPKVIFTTAYSEYALESCDLEVIDYLLKPIGKERFDKAIQKLQNRLETEKKAKAFELLEVANNECIKIKSGTETHKIYFNELIRLQAEGEYVKYITKNKNYLVLGSLKKLLLQLTTSFIQVHRSHIIALP